jgi:pimeloyl-ACP methyl ester carboxylesterase
MTQSRSSVCVTAEWSEPVPGHVRAVELTVDGGPLSGLAAEPAGEPRGLIVALHGGGARAEYWHSPVDEADSLLALAAALGWRAVAFDRPGYGASSVFARGLRAATQADLLDQALAIWEPSDRPVVLVGHSLGAIVAVHLAAADRPGSLLALSIGGVPLVFTPEQQGRIAAVDSSGPRVTRPPGAAANPADWYGPPGTWDERILDHRRRLVAPTPSEEFADARDAPAQLPALLGAIRVPVQFAAAEHELTTAPAPRLRAAADAALTSAPFVEHLLVAAAGHNLSLGRAARYYHCRILGFAEQALALRRARRPEEHATRM